MVWCGVCCRVVLYGVLWYGVLRCGVVFALYIIVLCLYVVYGVLFLRVVWIVDVEPVCGVCCAVVMNFLIAFINRYIFGLCE